jgi:hypothetical protein
MGHLPPLAHEGFEILGGAGIELFLDDVFGAHGLAKAALR